MKALLISLVLMSFTANASINDFECKFQGRQGEQVRVEVERAWGSFGRDMNVSVTHEGAVQEFRYFTNARLDNMRNRIEFFGAGVDLDIDLWPDQRPRFGRVYRAQFRSFDVNAGAFFNFIQCQYLGF
jgi:hypothetical protein